MLKTRTIQQKRETKWANVSARGVYGKFLVFITVYFYLHKAGYVFGSVCLFALAVTAKSADTS